MPIVPIHRLNEEPTRRGILADITCDSDGKIDHFVDKRIDKKILELHEVKDLEKLFSQLEQYGLSIDDYFLTQEESVTGEKLATKYALVQQDGRYRFAGPDRVRIERAAPTLEERVALVEGFLGRLT